MKLLSRLFNGIGSMIAAPFLSFGSWLLKVFLPRKGKRIIYLVVLYRALRKDSLSEKELKALNEKLNLVSQPGALAFPAVLSERLAVLLHQSVDDLDPDLSSYQPAVRGVINSIPKWMIYSDRATMVVDTSMILRYHKRGIA